jgi:type I restriction enzyme, S subunit
MTKQKQNPVEWPMERLSTLTDFLKDGTHFSPQSKSGPYRYLTSKNIRYGKLDLSNCCFISAEEHQRIFAACPVKTGDVLLTKDGANTGNAAINSLEEPISLLSSIAVLRGDPKILLNEFLLQFILSPRGQFAFLSEMAGQAITRLTLTVIGQIKIPVPSLSDQREIAAILSTWDQSIELTEKLVAAKQKLKLALMRRLVDLGDPTWPPIKLGKLFTHRKSKGKQGLPTVSVTMNSGLVPRDSLDRKNDTSLKPEQHLLIEKGDIAYNMMRMWQGASGLATDAGLVSPAYVVIRSRGTVDPAFASYWFKMPRVVKKFQDYSHGLTEDRLRLYYKDFATITLQLPPLKLQQQIAKAMQCCDRELDALQRKVALLKQQKKGLMQQLLTGKTRVKLPKGTA